VRLPQHQLGGAGDVLGTAGRSEDDFEALG